MLDNGRFKKILDQVNPNASIYDSIHQEISQELETELKELANAPLEEDEYDEIKAIRENLEIEGKIYQIYYGYALNKSMEHTSVTIQYIFDQEGNAVELNSKTKDQLVEKLYDKVTEKSS